jgi:hypothetical protein
MATRYIYTKEDLQNIGAGDADGAGWRVAGYDASWVMTDDYIIMNDIDLDGTVLTPIGGRGTASGSYIRFLGTLDGQGYKVYNGSVGGAQYYAGLFAFMGNGNNAGVGSGGYISNLYLYIDVSSTHTDGMVGGVAGVCAHTAGEVSVYNVHVEGDITGAGHTGGIIGYYQAGTISTCSYKGTVVGGTSQTHGVSGIVGSTNITVGTVKLYRCWVKEGTKIYGKYAAGGCMSYVVNPGSQTNYRVQTEECAVHADIYVLGTISGRTTTMHARAFAYGKFDILNCYFQGDQYITEVDNIGYTSSLVYNKSGSYGETNVENCYAKSAFTNNAATANNYGGGIVTTQGSVKNVFFDSTINGLPSDDIGTAKTTAQMKSIATYSAWDIVDYTEHDGKEETALWFIKDGEDYPRLWYEFIEPAPDVSVKIGGTFIKTENLYLKTGGSWETADKLFVKQGGAWVRI